MAGGFHAFSIDIIFHSNEEFISNGNPVADEYFASEPEGTEWSDHDLDFNVASRHASGFRNGFKLVTDHKYRKQFSRRLF